MSAGAQDLKEFRAYRVQGLGYLEDLYEVPLRVPTRVLGSIAVPCSLPTLLTPGGLLNTKP